MGYSKHNPKRKANSDTSLEQETNKISNKQPSLPPKGSREEKKEQTNSKLEGNK